MTSQIVKQMRFLFLIMASVGLLAVTAQAAEGWETDFAKAQAQAKAENKMLLIDFTGSDWCPWCMKLDREVFQTPEFKQYAAQNLVLVEADYPRSKPQSSEVKQQNQKLQSEYGIRGYPTVIVLDSMGKKIGELGYMTGGPSNFIAQLNKLKK